MSAPAPYQPTFLEKLVGKNYKWLYLLKYAFKQSNLKISSFLVFQIAVVLDFGITIFIWSLVNNSKQNITYFFIGFLIQRLVWTQFLLEFCGNIISGKIVNRLLQPTDFLAFTFFKELGNRVVPNLISASLIFTLLPFYADKLLLPSFNFWLLFPVFLVFGFIVDFLISLMLGCVAFWNEDYRPITFLATILIKVLSGLSIPFTYFPPFVATILSYNPYSYLNYHLTQIYLNKFTNFLCLSRRNCFVNNSLFPHQIGFQNGLEEK
jgi:ABC-type uncharacterized transport system permease subunit